MAVVIIRGEHGRVPCGTGQRPRREGTQGSPKQLGTDVYYGRVYSSEQANHRFVRINFQS